MNRVNSSVLSGLALSELAPLFRARLEARRQEILGRRHEIHVERVAEDEEQAQILVRNESAALRASHGRAELRRINEALQRITDGIFGICTDCEGQIATKRLEADPAVERCIRCQERFEAVERAEREASRGANVLRDVPLEREA